MKTIGYKIHRSIKEIEILQGGIDSNSGMWVERFTYRIPLSKENVEQLKKIITTKTLYKKPLTLYQGLHIQFSHSLFSEIFLLLLIFFYLFLKGIGVSLVISVILLFSEIYLTLNILLSILRGIANLYFSFYNAPKGK